MKSNPYLGHASQLCSVEEVRLVGGRGEGMRLLQIRTPSGMELTVAPDRCADIYRLIFKGINLGYFSPCGYVAPAYYDCQGLGFLKSFTAGFLTTCGIHTVGSPSEDDGEELGLHGNIGNTPCDYIWWTEDDTAVRIHAVVNDSILFSRKLELHRDITISKQENKITIDDMVYNNGDKTSPLMMMYHMNMGYPLLSENSVVTIPSVRVEARNEHSADGIETWNKMLPPTANFEEQCYYHFYEECGLASIYNPDINKGVEIRFDLRTLDMLNEWKMMGVRDYCLGLEPCNCTPAGRKSMRESGKLKYLDAGGSETFHVEIRLFEY